MPPTRPAEVVALLQSPTLRVRTGLWLVPPALLGQERNEASRLGIEATDLREPLLASLAPETQFLGLTAQQVSGLLTTLAEEAQGTNCLLLYNLDLLLARLKQQERQEVWQYLYQALPHRRRALLIVMPKEASALLPSSTMLDKWQREGRLAD